MSHISNNSVSDHHHNPVDRHYLASKLPHHPRFMYSKPPVDMSRHNQTPISLSSEPSGSCAYSPSQPKFPNQVHGVTSRSHSVPSVSNGPNSLSQQSRSLLQSFRKLTHRAKASRACSSELPQLEISSPVLVTHHTANKMFDSVFPLQDSPICSPTSCPPLSANSVSYDSLTSSEKNDSTSKLNTTALDDDSSVASYNSDSTFDILGLAARDNLEPLDSMSNDDTSRRLSKSLPAQSAAKIILGALPPPPALDAPRPPSKSSSRMSSIAKKTSKTEFHNKKKDSQSIRDLDMNDNSVSVTESYQNSYNPPLTNNVDQELYMNSFGLKNSPQSHTFDSSEVGSAHDSSLSQSYISNNSSKNIHGHKSLSPVKGTQPSVADNLTMHLSQNSHFDSQSRLCSIQENSTSSQDALPEDTQLVRSLKAQNEFLARELEWTKRLLASEVQERHRIVSDMQKSIDRYEAISSHSCEKLAKVMEENRLLEKEAHLREKIAQL